MTFLEPRVLREDRDARHQALLPARPAPPVFVLGLHRSGTTWLYQVLADLFPVAVTTLHHVTHYHRLVDGRVTGTEAAQRAELAAALRDRGIADRGIDGFPVGPDSLEEYAFILRKFSPHWGVTPANADLMDAYMRKLTWLAPEAPALLLKNPFDLAAAPYLLERWPDARFVFIRRDLVRVLNSQFRNHFVYRKGLEPYLGVLLAGIPGVAWTFKAMAALDRVVPDAWYQAGAVRHLKGSIAGQLRAHYATYDRVPADRRVEVTYEDLLADPAATVARLQAFLGLPFRPGAVPPAASPRVEPLQLAVEQHIPAVSAAMAPYPDARLTAPPTVPRP